MFFLYYKLYVSSVDKYMFTVYKLGILGNKLQNCYTKILYKILLHKCTLFLSIISDAMQAVRSQFYYTNTWCFDE